MLKQKRKEDEKMEILEIIAGVVCGLGLLVGMPLFVFSLQ
jgi:hypothetical protein